MTVGRCVVGSLSWAVPWRGSPWWCLRGRCVDGPSVRGADQRRRLPHGFGIGPDGELIALTLQDGALRIVPKRLKGSSRNDMRRLLLWQQSVAAPPDEFDDNQIAEWDSEQPDQRAASLVPTRRPASTGFQITVTMRSPNRNPSRPIGARA